MPSTTTLGYPYPDPTDAIAACAAKVQELAQKVDDELGLIKHGTESINAVNVNTDYSAVVAFTGTAFPGVPTITANISNRVNPAVYEPVLISGKSATGFTIYVRRSGGSAAVDVDWQAIYK